MSHFNISIGKALVGYVILCLLMMAGCNNILSNFSDELDEADKNLDESRSLLLSDELDNGKLASFLVQGDYIPDKAEAKFVAAKIMEAWHKEPFANLGVINKIKIPASEALESGAENFRQRILLDYAAMGQDATWSHAATADLPSQLGEPDDGYKVEIIIKNDRKDTNPGSLAGIPVRILHWYHADNNDSGTTGIVADTLGFIKTDAKGKAVAYLPAGESYSILPIQKGYQYGREKGTIKNGHLSDNEEFNFTQKHHTLSPLSRSVYSALREDQALYVRTPDAFRHSLKTGCFLYLFCCFIFLLFTYFKDNKVINNNNERRKAQAAGETVRGPVFNQRSYTDYLLVIVLMTLVGMGILTLYGMFKPLTDMPQGETAAFGACAGLVVMFLVSCVNFQSLYIGKSKVNNFLSPLGKIRQYCRSWKPIDNLYKKCGTTNDFLKEYLGNGYMFLFLAFILLICLMFFGSGPDGSDAKVNLGPIQPSEFCKYLFIFFCAAYFTGFGDTIRKFSEVNTDLSRKRLLRYVGGILAMMAVLMLFYLGVSDLGPALIVAFTFIILYAVVQEDVLAMLLGTGGFALLLILGTFLTSFIGISSGWGIILAIVIFAFGYWLLCLKGKGRIHESALMMSAVILLYAGFGKAIAAIFPSEAERFAGRTAMMWEGAWNNNINGGDQIAQGLWSLASGGIDGMGLGNGSPSVVPAGHTDMIFTTLGETFGWIGVLLVVVCFTILIVRTIYIAKRTGYTYPFYLTLGIGIVSGVQFLFIVLGSMGLIPLSGVSVPLLSSGRTSLILTMAMFGIVLSCSTLIEPQKEKNSLEEFDDSLKYLRRFFRTGCALIVIAAFYYQVIDRNDIIIRPTCVNNTTGARILEYNPRINMLLDRLMAGNIYDRNGLLLATSERASLSDKEIAERLKKAGIAGADLRAEAAKHKKRYYPFGNDLLFMVGDYNTRKVYSFTPTNPTGYLAESRHRHSLRGLDIPMTTFCDSSASFRPNRFMPKERRTDTLVRYDYTNLLPFLGMGLKDNVYIEQHNKERNQRDIVLTVDAALQKRLQNDMKHEIEGNSNYSSKKNLRASVVVLDAANGDLLASANYPLPEQDSIHMLAQRRMFQNNPAELLPGHHAPITERDLGLTFQTAPGSTAKVMSAMAGFMGLGTEADKIRYYNYPEEIIHPTGYWLSNLNVRMREAISHSSNNFFINLIHDQDLYDELDSVYYTVGIRMDEDVYGRKDRVKRTATPYFFEMDELDNHELFTELLDDNRSHALKTYRDYKENRQKKKKELMNWGSTAIAWGQGLISATPLNMARVASIVANDGKLVPTRYVLREGEKKMDTKKPVRILSSETNKLLKSYMQEESGLKKPRLASAKGIGGKTGTPQRAVNSVRAKKNLKKGLALMWNDAWYIFFVESGKQGHPLAVAVRLERTVGRNSGLAVNFVNDVVLPSIDKAGYKVLDGKAKTENKKKH